MQINRQPMPAKGLYLITPERCCERLDQIRAAVCAGASILQYRNKTQDPSQHLAQAQALRTICWEFDLPLIINDDVELAYAVGAAGVHLGMQDADPRAARARLGDAAIIGVSCYDSLERAMALSRQGASYLAFGSFFKSPTKPNAKPVSAAILAQAKQFGLPLVAIGGITPTNGANLINAGADFLAVISGVFSDADPGSAARRYANLFN